MKVEVNVRTPANQEATSKVELVVSATDTVASIKDRVTALQLIPFPDQDLMLNGEVLSDTRQMLDCGVKELTSSLDLVVKASEATLAEQLKELLQARDLSCDELGLLYCYKHGVSIGQALQTLGLPGEKLQDFLRRHGGFRLEGNHVALARKEDGVPKGTNLKLFSVATEVEQILKASSTGCMDMQELCDNFAAKFNVTLSSIVGKPADYFFHRERERFQVTGRSLVSLRSAGPPLEPTQPCPQDHGSDCIGGEGALLEPVEPPPGLGGEVPRQNNQRKFPDPGKSPQVRSHKLKPRDAGHTSKSVEGCAANSLDGAESQQYLDLHHRICNRPFCSKATQALSDIVEAVLGALFLNVVKVVKGGSIGKGTAISGSPDAEVVFFLRGLPPSGHERWLPSLLRSTAGTLSERLGEEKGVEWVKATEDSVQLRVKGLASLDMRFSPVFGSYAETVRALGAQGPEARRFYTASLVEERVQFIARQPGQVKVTIRLLKWWRDQQAWSSSFVRPSDDILELMAIYTAVQTKPPDQRAAIANVMSLLSRFDELRIVWSNYYTKADVWAPLLRQRPLLMDPVNPFVNIADPQLFDARELMEAARTTHFFW